MPTFLITSPDGRKLKVTAPDGATEADALAYAKANMPEIQGMNEESDPSYTQRMGLALSGGVKAVGAGAQRFVGEHNLLENVPELGFAGDRPSQQEVVQQASSLAREGSAETEQSTKGLNYIASLPIEAIGSAPTTLAALGAGLINPVLGLGVAGLSQGAATYGSEREKGLSVEDATFKALTMGTVEGLTEKIPIDTLVKAMKGPLRNRILKRMAAEGIQEAAVQTVEEAYDKGILDRDVNFWEALGRIGHSAIVGSVAAAPIAAPVSYSEVSKEKAEEFARKRREARAKTAAATTQEAPQLTEREQKIAKLDADIAQESDPDVKDILSTRKDNLYKLGVIEDKVSALNTRLETEEDPERRAAIQTTLGRYNNALKQLQRKVDNFEQKHGLKKEEAQPVDEASQILREMEEEAALVEEESVRAAELAPPQYTPPFQRPDSEVIPETELIAPPAETGTTALVPVPRQQQVTPGAGVIPVDEDLNEVSPPAVLPEESQGISAIEASPEERRTRTPEEVSLEAQAGQTQKIWYGEPAEEGATPEPDLITTPPDRSAGELRQGVLTGKATKELRGPSPVTEVTDQEAQAMLPEDRNGEADERYRGLWDSNLHGLKKKFGEWLDKAKTPEARDAISQGIRNINHELERRKHENSIDITPDMIERDGVKFQEDLDPAMNKGKPLSRGLVQKIAEEFIASWDSAAKPKIRYFEDFWNDPNIPEKVKEKAREVGAKNPPAFAWGKYVFINTKLPTSRQQVIRSIAHEALGHIAVEINEGGLLNFTLDSIYEKRTAEVNQFARNYKQDETTAEGRRTATKEFIAHLAERNPKHSIVRQYIYAIRQLLRKMGVNLKLRDIDIIERVIMPARRLMETGKPDKPIMPGGRAIGVSFARDFTDYDSMDAADLRRLYNNLKRNNKTEELAKVREALLKKGVNPTEFPQQQEIDDLGPIDENDTPKFQTTLREYPDNFKGALTSPTKTKPKTIQTDIEEREQVKDSQAEDNEGVLFQQKLEEDTKKASGLFMRGFDFTRQLITSTADKFKEIPGLERLGQAIQDMVDHSQRYRGIFNEQLSPGLEALDHLPRLVRKEILLDFEAYIAAKQNKDTKTADEILNSGRDELRGLVESVEAAFNAAGDRMEKLGVMVYDPVSGKYRPFKKLKDFFPNIMKPEYRDALLRPRDKKGNFTKKFLELSDHLIKANYSYTDEKGQRVPVKTPEDVLNYVKSAAESLTFESGFFGNIERARTLPFPVEVYDTSLSAVHRYRERWAERLAQIEAFGQEVPALKKKDMFADVLESIQGKGDPRAAHVEQVKTIIYGDRQHYGLGEKLAQTASTLATGLQISGPMSVMKNFIGGITNVSAFMDVQASMKGMADMLSTDSRQAAYELMNNLGIITDDFLRTISDIEIMGLQHHAGFEKVRKGVTEFTGYVMGLRTLGPLRHISFNSSEAAVRVTTGLAAKYQLDMWKQAYDTDPSSRRSKVFVKFAAEEGIDIEALMAEKGVEDIKSSPQTARFIRRMVNRAQGSYRQDQVPYFLDTWYGKFLFKYTKYGFQLARMFDKQVTQNLRSGDPDLFREGAANLGKYIGLYSVMGYTTASAVKAIFGSALMPSIKEIVTALEELDDEDKEQLPYLANLIFSSMHVMGAFGPLSMAYNKYQQWADYGEDPVNAPGLSVFMNLGEEIGKMIAGREHLDFGIVADRSFDWLMQNQSITRQGRQAMAETSGFTPLLYNKRTVAISRQAAKRFADSRGIELSKGGGSVSKYNILNDDINQALMMGRPDKAAERYERALGRAKTVADEEGIENAVKAAVLSRRPMAVNGAIGDKAGYVLFDEWAQKHLPKSDYERIKKLDDAYIDAAIEAGLLTPKNVSDAAYNKAVRDYERGLEPLGD